MTTEVLFNEDDYVWGEWSKNNPLSPIQQTTYIENESYFRAGKLQKLEVGKTYATKNGSSFTCVVKVNGYFYMVATYEGKIQPSSPAYTWAENGVSVNLTDGYNVDWSVEPYEMSINE